jgi:hypothetical protein
MNPFDEAQAITEKGLAIVPDVPSPKGIAGLIDELSRAGAARSTAGVRHANNSSRVATCAVGCTLNTQFRH